jgi:multidrug resistance efflux pump
MKKTLVLLVVLGSLAGVGARLMPGDDPRVELRNLPSSGLCHSGEVAANGVVEGARPEVALRPEVVGVIKAIRFRENQPMRRGAVLVELDNECRKAKVASAKADLALALAQREQLQNGVRAEKRKAIRAAADARKANYEQARAEYERSQQLMPSRAVSREQADAAYYMMLRAKAQWQEAQDELALVEAPARADEMKAADAKVAAAQARLKQARAELAKTRLRAPYDGQVLQVFAEPGEMAGPATAQPVLLLADVSKRRVRAFVEELDVARVKVGQKATVTADGLPGRTFYGTVAVMLPRMGKRAPQSDTPGEYKDVYYREVLIDLDKADALPLNLRVQTRIGAAATAGGPMEGVHQRGGRRPGYDGA